MQSKAYIKLESINDIKEFEALLDESFINYDIKWNSNIGEFEVENEFSFVLKIKKIHQIAFLDLNIKSSFLVVPFFNNIFFKYINNCSNNVFTIYDIFLANIKNEQIIKDSKELLKNISADNLNTIKAYIDSNLDANKAAEELYLHKNSFAYRIKKFSSDTGYDYHDINNIMFLNLLISLIK